MRSTEQGLVVQHCVIPLQIAFPKGFHGLCEVVQLQETDTARLPSPLNAHGRFGTAV